jgi:hypothetical protein
MKYIRDGIVPADYYDTKSIAEYERIPPDEMAKYAKYTLEAIQRAANERDLDIRDFAEIYNTHRNGYLSNKNINAFLWNRRLEPFGHLFKLFIGRRKSVSSNNILLCCGFGVRKTYYERYKADGSLPSVGNRGKLPKYDTPARAGRSKVEFPDGGRVDIPMNAIYRRFKDGIDACNRMSRNKVTVPEMVLLAIREFMDHRKEIFDVQAVQIDEDKLVTRTNERLYVDADSELVEKIYKFLQRYNAVNPIPITMSQFMEKAAQAHLDRLPPELVAPEILARERAVEEMEQMQ